MKIPSFLRLPTVVELGRSKTNALPMRLFDKDTDDYCWEDYQEEMKEKYPIRYFLFDTFPRWWRVKIGMNIEYAIYWLRSRLIYKDHLIDILPKNKKVKETFYDWGYLDPDRRLLIAAFTILSEHVESTHEYNMFCNDISFEEIKNDPMLWNQYLRYYVAKSLYIYWHHERPAIENSLEPGDFYGRNDLYEYDNLMLKSLIDIRSSLWT
jgi:hypothetical protein